ncbi:hypothetical protein NPA08_03970 [Mycoplasmopsis citelli]|uniref:hypothetical protein n=1 Tax=Mycoplasmopsis citelli TaxID=171281 RepID=UPI00211546E3|nr:hypothetical protein [Mycoplasmopsis citelli]UUD36083.1 hypothetical protein NPA08_03970 [Mycoplasmopsis citelli]
MNITEKLLKARSLAKMSLIIWLINILFFILLIIEAVITFGAFLIPVIWIVLFGISVLLFVIGSITIFVAKILLTIKLSEIKGYYLANDLAQSNSYGTLMILTIVGFFIPIISIVTYFMILNRTSESLSFSKSTM